MVFKKGQVSYWKGKKLPKETKLKMRQNHADVSGKNNPMYGKKRFDMQGDKNPAKRPEVRKKIRNHALVNNSNYLPGVNKKQRISMMNRITERGGPKLGKNEKQIIDKWETIINYKILRQYPTCGYFLDGYCKELNLAFEVDEKHHFDVNGKLKKKDIIRQENIENELNCDFIREVDY